MNSTTASTLTALTMAYKLIHHADRTAQRAADGALEHLLDGTTYAFDGSELRILARRRNGDGVWYHTNGVSCTCEAHGQAICRHRALYALLLAQAALDNPLMLRAQIIEQIAPSVRVAPCAPLPFEVDPMEAWPQDLPDLYPQG